jgi:hypothetical protein
VRVRADRSSYRQLDPVVVTTTNRSARTVYDHHCGGGVEGYEYLRRWNGSYGMSRACVDFGGDGWRAHSVAIAPGGAHRDTLFVSGLAYTGTWRVQLRLLDEAGALLPEPERTSATFRVRGSWAP